jgi:teichuronic acid biosynthesis glycosyltransferase TuaG
MDLVSIVMPAYNAENFITEAIQSVINQNHKNWELIIINDGSNDNTNEKIHLFINDKRIKLINIENTGVSYARNLGLKKANGKYISFLDSDDKWDCSFLEDNLATLKTNNAGLVFSNHYIIDEKSNIINEYQVNDAYIKNFKPQIDLLKVDYIGILTVCINKELCNSELYFDSNLNGVEDWDLWYRLSNQTKFIFLNKNLSYYREHANGASKNIYKQALNRIKYYKKNIHYNQKIQFLSKYVLLFFHLRIIFSPLIKKNDFKTIFKLLHNII